jgi:uncharacterized repeat protein (TIGR01451 family)
MNKTFFKICLGWLALAGLAWPAGGADTALKTLPGHVPAVISHLSAVSRLAATNELHLAIGLPLRNQEAMTTLLQQVSDPSSPNYRQYLTSEQFTAQFGPTEEDAQAVIKFAQANGLTVKRVHGNRVLIEVDGKAADVERAFNVTLRSYHLAAENRDFYAPDQEPSVPAALPVADVQGLNNYARPHPRIRVGPVKASSTRLGSGPLGSYLGNDFRPAYVPGTALTGAGQKVALFEYDSYLASDITLYEQRSGLPAVALTNILLQGFPAPIGGQGEVTLDIDMAIAMAPGLSQILVYEGNFGVAYLPNLVLNQIAVDNFAHQVSCSWGWSGGPSATTDAIFQQMILQGQTFFDASGDVCAFLPPGQPGSVDDPTLNNAPSDDPYITQVGATTLQTTGPGGAFVSESVWNWAIEFPGQGYDGVGSSGGISGYYTIPTWQQGVSMVANQGSPTMRNLPDVAMTGDNIDIIVNGADQPGTGGTSCAAPLWAGFTALVNQQAAQNGLGVVGFLNPALYALAKGPNYNNYFHDVVTGNNTWSQSPNLFYAVPGFDLCDGWGSPNGTNLINALATASNAPVIIATPVIPAPQQPWGTTLSVMDGADPNGLWLLYFQDDVANGYSGTNYNGWSVNLTTANPVGFAADNQLTVNTRVNGLSYGNATNVPAIPGSYWYLTLAVTNYGPSISSGVFVSDILPDSPGVTFVSAVSSLPQSTTNIVNKTLTWNVTTTNSVAVNYLGLPVANALAVGAGGTLTLTFQVAGNATPLAVYQNSATVSAVTTDPNPDDDSILVIATVSAPPMLLPVLIHGAGAGAGLQLTVTNDPGATVVIQTATNLVPPVTWLPVATNVSPFTFTNFATTNLHQFYRAYIPQ